MYPFLLHHHQQYTYSLQITMAHGIRIRDEARRLEDLIESNAAAQFLSQYQSNGVIGALSLDLSHLKSDVDLFLRRSTQMGAEYLKELNKPPESSLSPEPEQEPDMVGLSDLFLTIRDRLTSGSDRRPCFTSFIVSGMAGSGKTTLIKKVFNDPLIEKAFECRAFVRVGQKYDFVKILVAIVAQLNAGREGMVIGGAESIHELFKRSLRGARFLIVLDDVWDNVLESSRRKNLLEIIPKDCDRCAFITSRLQKGSIVRNVDHGYGIRFLTEEESWELLQKKVFEEEECPSLLVKAGKKIAEKCEGLPLLIVSVGKLLSQAEEKTPEYWNNVSKRAFFIWAFPKDHVIRRSRIVN